MCKKLCQMHKVPRSEIDFIKPGEKSRKRVKKEAGSYLDGATDWHMQVDLGKKLRVPAEVAPTDLRPDLILISNSTKRMGVMKSIVLNIRLNSYCD